MIKNALAAMAVTIILGFLIPFSPGERTILFFVLFHSYNASK